MTALRSRPPGAVARVRAISRAYSRACSAGRVTRFSTPSRARSCFRLAALLEGSYLRALNGKMDRKMGEGLHKYAQWQWAKAYQEISR